MRDGAPDGGVVPDDGYRGNQPRSTQELSGWLQGAEAEPVLDPGLPIVDAHHHVFGAPGDRLVYQLADLQRDVESGHRVAGTVYIEAYEANWRTTGPPEMRPVGEVEWIAQATEQPLRSAGMACQVAAGIVSHADLDLGDAVRPVLEAQLAAGQGRMCGVRVRSSFMAGTVARHTWSSRRPGMLADPGFRRGFATLDGFGLSFDAWVFHTQVSELIELADAFPRTAIIVNHLAGPIGIGEFRQRRAEMLQGWRTSLGALAARPNVVMKVGGMGMPLLGHDFSLRPAPPGSVELAQAWQPYVEAAVDVFGTGRCMLESNFPVDKQSCSYRSLWNAFKLITQGWSADERDDLFHRTACRVYRLPDLARRCAEPPMPA